MKNQTKKLLYLFSIIFLCLITAYLGTKTIHNVKILLWPDSTGYLHSAIDALENGVFTHIGYRSFVYPFVLYLILLVSESPLSIIYVQLIAAYLSIIIVFSLGLIVINKPKSHMHYFLFKFLSLGTIIYLVIAYRPIWNLAQAVMPETLASLLLAFWSFGIIVLFYSNRCLMRYLGMFISMTIASLIYLVKPHFILVSLVMPLCTLLLANKLNAHERQLSLFKSSCIYAFSLCIFLVAYQTDSHLKHLYAPSHSSELFGARSIFCNNANIVIKNKNPEQFIPGLYSALELTVNKPSEFVIQGFDGDNCMYGEAGAIVRKYYEGEPALEVEYYLKNYFQSILDTPKLLFYRIYQQSKYLILHLWVSGDEILTAGDAVLAGVIDHRKIFFTWRERYHDSFLGAVYTPFLIGFNFISMVTGALIILATVIITYSWFFKKSLSRAGGAFVIVMIFFLLTNSLISIVHTFDNARYITVQWPIVVTLTLLSLVTCLDVFCAKYKNWRNSYLDC